MAVSAEQLRSLRFDEGLRGYDKRQVDKVITRVADLVEELQNRLSEAEGRAAAAEARVVDRAAGPVSRQASPDAAELDETLRKTLILAQRTADAAVKEAREEAAQLRDDARAEADGVLADAKHRAEELGAEAEAQRSTLLADARAEAARIIGEARTTCEERIARVEAELAEAHESRRDELLAQITQLSGIRDALAADVEQLEAHLGTRRERIRDALGELTALLEDPDKLDVTTAPELADVDVPDPDDFAPATLSAPTLDEFPDAEAGSGPGATGAGGGQAAAVLLGEVGVARSVPADDDPVVDLSDGPATAAHEAVADDAAWSGLAGVPGEPVDEPARPAWADAVPPAPEAAGSDPFLDELRRASGDEDDAAMDRFFTDEDEERRSGWFRRRP